MSSKNHDPSFDAYHGILPPSNEEIALLEAALQRSGRPYTDDDLLALMAWQAQTQVSLHWLARVQAGEGVLVVEGKYVQFIETMPRTPGGRD